MTEIKAILFDLDGTLLDSDMQVFLPHYLKQLAARVAHLIPPKEFIAHLLAATQAMVDNDGRATNAQVFAEAFYPRVGHSQTELEPVYHDRSAVSTRASASATGLSLSTPRRCAKLSVGKSPGTSKD